MMKIDQYNYHLPEELIANSSANPRDASRLLVYKTEDNSSVNDVFYNLGRYLNPSDLIITNNSRVMPSRIYGQKETGGGVEFLIIERKNDSWLVLVGGKVNVGNVVKFDGGLTADILEKNGKECLVKFNKSDSEFWSELEKIGQMPIPPYIKKSNQSEQDLRTKYQTVYANKYSSAAAPTAGLHFSKKLIGELELAGIQFTSIDLHVGLGTFLPISDADIKKKKLHSENFDIPHSTVEKILETKKNGGRIFAVGTTTVRAVESSVSKILSGEKEISGSTDIFIQPGDKFKIVDGLITNFHLPKSSLMMLVAAFVQSKTQFDGRQKLLELYQIAIENNYRFYSFGDAMLII